MIGQTLGPYEVLAKLGAGGMGEVYRATDTNLKRQVALKVLPAAVANDAERLARFKREAEVLAALNHPHIAQIYGLEKSGDATALVMELVEGEDLSQRIARGAIPLDEALPIAGQIADALEAAHEQGIIHRDLKPANIKVRADGTVKVLDFGLAKALEAGGAGQAGGAGRENPSMSPTLTAATQLGMILGTAAYMAPEQAKGKAVDKRADIWAFGVVVYEMLTGQRAFKGDDISETLASVLKDTPSLDALPAATPPRLRQLLKRCLERDPKMRLRDIGEARVEIARIHETGVDAIALPAPIVATARVPLAHRAWPWAALAGVLGVALIVSLVSWAPWKPAPAPPAPRKLLVSIGADGSLTRDVGAIAILSPDGSMLAFVGQQGGQRRLFIRKLDQLNASPLGGTEGASSPFFSPDGQWLAFFAGDKLKKVSVTGGAAVTVCDTVAGRGGTWADDDTIVFSPSSGTNVTLMRVAAAGGTASPFTTLSTGATTQRWPQALPDGKGVLFSEHATQTNWDGGNILVAPLTGGPSKVVLRGGYYGRYVSGGLGRRSLGEGGHLLYMQQGTLFAVRFDLDRLEPVGQAVPVVENVAANPATTGGAQFSLSSEGTLVYLPGTATTMANPIDWIARDGKIAPLRAARSNWTNPSFSPDGQKLAIEINDGKQRDIWVYEWARDTLTQLTFEAGNDAYPVWTPDGKRITFASDRATPGILNVYWVNADGTGDVARLTDAPAIQVPISWHPSGRFLAFTAPANPAVSPQTDVMILPMDGDAARGWTPGKPFAFFKESTPANESSPAFSPDGRWIAYQVTDSAITADVYVRPFPGPGGQWRVSTAGGAYPSWSKSTQAVTFLELSLTPKLMFAPYSVAGDSFRADAPQVWSPSAMRGVSPVNHVYSLHPDGKRAAAMTADESGGGLDKVVFVTDFAEHLRTIAPGRK